MPLKGAWRVSIDLSGRDIPQNSFGNDAARSWCYIHQCMSACMQYGAFEDSSHIVLIEEYASMVRSMASPCTWLATTQSTSPPQGLITGYKRH